MPVVPAAHAPFGTYATTFGTWFSTPIEDPGTQDDNTTLEGSTFISEQLLLVKDWPPVVSAAEAK